MNQTQLPSPPELPLQRYDEIRAELLSAVDRTRRPSQRRWPAPAAVGMATAVVIGVVVVATGVWTDDPPDRRPVGQGSSPHPPVFDEPDADRDRFEAQCRDLPDADRFRIYNYVNNPVSGEFAVLYSDNGFSASCNRLAAWDQPIVMPSSSRSGQWLAGHAAPVVSNHDGNAHLFTLVGRTSAKVARVTVSVGTDTVEAHIANYTYIGVIGHPASVDPDDVIVTIRAYDAAGNLLNERRQGGKPTSEECWITPDGRHLSGYDDTPADECRPAPRWPMFR